MKQKDDEGKDLTCRNSSLTLRIADLEKDLEHCQQLLEDVTRRLQDK